MSSASNYIPIDVISKDPVNYSWSDWDPYESIPKPDEKVKEILKKVSNAGITAFSVGCAEWIVYRLSKEMANENRSFEFLDACWMFLTGKSPNMPPVEMAGFENQIRKHEPEGQLRGPVHFAFDMVTETWNQGEFGPPVAHAAVTASVALHVLREEGKALFLKWQEKALEKLQRVAPRNEKEPEGLPIARDILDPNI